MKGVIDFSAVVTVHNEGLVVHKTMRSIFEALDNVEKNGYNYELIVHIDNGDKCTSEYFERYQNNKKVRVFKNSFGDAGPSRNFAAKKAKGKYVGFFDGDDLVSPNWFIEAINILEASKEEIVVHPEAVLTFGINQKNILTLQKDSLDKNTDTLMLLGENRWCSVLVAKKETLKKIPYRTMGKGYGHEDYVFNIEAMEKGVLHKVAKGTVLFYRRSDTSRLSSGNKNNVTIPFMEAFDLEKIRKIKSLEQKNKKRSIKEKGYGFYKKIRGNRYLNFFITPVAKLTMKAIDYKPPALKRREIPDFVISEWKKINHIDTQLYPHEYILNKVLFYVPEEQIVVGNTLHKIAQYIRGKTDYIFIVPWAVRGGADKVLFNYIKALKEINPSWRFAVIATLEARNLWAEKLPEYVDFVDFGNLTAGLPPVLQETVFTRLIVQFNCKRMHIINSEYGYEWVRKHKDLMEKYDLVVSLFAWEYIRGSDMKAVYSYDNPCLFEIFDVVKKVFTDNEAMINYSVEENGFSRDKFKVHYQPIIDIKGNESKEGLIDKGKLRIMWAGRVAPVKLPELVVEIGKRLKKNKYCIDVYGEIDKDVDRGIFDGVQSIKYCGAYDGFSSLPTDKYDVLLYTSLTDGMPNVILEAAAAGLPIVASNDGGVGEFIRDRKTGVLVKDYLNPDAYIRAFKEILDKPEVLSKYTKNARKLLEERHGWEGFVEAVKEDIDF